MSMSNTEDIINEHRAKVLGTSFSIASSFSTLKLLADMYLAQLNVEMLSLDPKNPEDDRRQLLVLQSIKTIYAFVAWIESNIREYRSIQEGQPQKVGKAPFTP